MKQATLWIIIKDDKILLCMKKRWFWEGFWNGPGWKIEAWETEKQAMIREMQEETTLEAKENDLEKVWVLHFYFDKDSTWNLDAHVFKIFDFEWTPTETEEMKPEWFEISQIPYDQMWEDDKIWFPRMLAGEQIEYDFYFWNDGKIRDYKVIQ